MTQLASRGRMPDKPAAMRDFSKRSSRSYSPIQSLCFLMTGTGGKACHQ